MSSPSVFSLATLSAAAGLTLGVSLVFPAAAKAAGMTDIDVLGGNYTSGYAVSGNGLVIVGRGFNISGDFEAFRYDGTMYRLGNLSGNYSAAYGVSHDGNIIVGNVMVGAQLHPFRYDVSTSTMTDMGPSLHIGTFAAVSGDGHVAVGQGNGGWGGYVMRQVDAAAPENLGHLNGGSGGEATGVSHDGSVIVGISDNGVTTLGFRYVGGVMTSVGTLGGTTYDWSRAWAVSADGTTVVGQSTTSSGVLHAFKHVTLLGGSTFMFDLGVLTGGTDSMAKAVSADGSVVVGYSEVLVGGSVVTHAMRHTIALGMEDLGTLGGSYSIAFGISSDGSIITGESYLAGDTVKHAFIYTDTVMLDVNDWMSSLNGPNSVLAMSGNLASLPMEGAHHRPLMSYDGMGKAGQAWATGDFGSSSRKADSHATTGEIGVSTTYGNVVAGLAAGYGAQNQDLALGGSAHVTGNYVLAEFDYRLPDKQSILSAVLMSGRWTSATARAYATGAGTSVSNGTTEISTESLRLRYDGPATPLAGRLTASPFLSVAWTRAKADAYQESGGSFDASFDAQSHTSSEGRLGLTAKYALGTDTTLLVTSEWIRRFDRTSGTLTGVDSDHGALPFSVSGFAPTKNQARFGFDIDHKLDARTLLNFSAHFAGFGEAPDASAALSIRRAF
jgi:probable HAF family extracellular repeat protein